MIERGDRDCFVNSFVDIDKIDTVTFDRRG